MIKFTKTVLNYLPAILNCATADRVAYVSGRFSGEFMTHVA